MITNFKLFEQSQQEQDWKLLLDLSKIWKDSIYQNNSELIRFNDQYINFLNQQKDLIIRQTSEEAWIKLQELITSLTENKDKITESSSIWDDIYDWADSNMVEIQVQPEIETITKDF
jgi:hypothetical protein